MDKISEMLTRIRNAQKAGKKEVKVEFSNLKFALAKIFEKEGFLGEVSKENSEKNFSWIKMKLKYFSDFNNRETPAIQGIRRISKLGKRVYLKKKNIKEVKNKYGTAVLSTSQGLMTGEESKKAGLGGEYICEIW